MPTHPFCSRRFLDRNEIVQRVYNNLVIHFLFHLLDLVSFYESTPLARQRSLLASGLCLQVVRPQLRRRIHLTSDYAHDDLDLVVHIDQTPTGGDGARRDCIDDTAGK